MHQRLIAIIALVCFAFGGGGCAFLFESPKTAPSRKNKRYQEVLLPLQTGSTLHRRTFVERGPEVEPKKKSKKKESSGPKAETEPSATPAPEEESTPPADRFR